MAIKSKAPTTRNTKVVEVAWGSVELEMVPKTFTPSLPPLPYKQWMQVCSFLKFCQTDRQGEGIISLTLIKKKWHIICWHQESIGMHVKYEEGSDENQAILNDELREALDNIHCTVHSHYTAGAFQSGDDKDDELQKIGWHVTVGKMNQPSMDSHARWNLNKPARRENGLKVENSIQSWIEFNAESIVAEFKAPKGYLAHPAAKSSHKQNVHITPNNSFFPEEWKERVRKKTYAPVKQTYHYPTSAMNPMLGLSSNVQVGTNFNYKRDAGSDFTSKEIDELSGEEIMGIAQMILHDAPFIEQAVRPLMHAAANKTTKAQVYMKTTKAVIEDDLMKLLHSSLPETDARVLARSAAMFIIAFLKSEKYTWSRFSAVFKATYEIDKTKFNELFQSFQDENLELSAGDEVKYARQELEMTMGVQAVKEMSDKDVMSLFSL